MLTGCFWRTDQSFFSPLQRGKKPPQKVSWDEVAQHHCSAGWISHTTMKILFFTGLLSFTSSLCTTGESSFLYLFHLLVNNMDFLIMLLPTSCEHEMSSTCMYHLQKLFHDVSFKTDFYSFTSVTPYLCQSFSVKNFFKGTFCTYWRHIFYLVFL